MFRMWCKLFDDRGHLIKDTVIKNADSDLNRTRKIFAAIHDACYEFDLAEPIWLDSNVSAAYFRYVSGFSLFVESFFVGILCSSS